MEQLESNLELICFQLCAAMFSGCREYRNSGVKVVTGCTSIPAPESKVGAIFEICLVFNITKISVLFYTQEGKHSLHIDREHFQQVS